MYPPPSPSLPPEYDWFSGPTTPKTQLAVAWVVCLTYSIFYCLLLLAAPNDKADDTESMAFGFSALFFYVPFLICFIVWIVLMNQPTPSIVGGVIIVVSLVSACFLLCRRRNQSIPPTTGTTSTSGSTPSPTKPVASNPNTSTQKALLALKEDGFSCRALSPQTDASDLQLLEALLQTERLEQL